MTMTPAKAQRILFQYEEDIYNPTLKDLREPDSQVEHGRILRKALTIVHRHLREQAAQAAAAKTPEPVK